LREIAISRDEQESRPIDTLQYAFDRDQGRQSGFHGDGALVYYQRNGADQHENSGEYDYKSYDEVL
jgi:hypothetical protein